MNATRGLGLYLSRQASGLGRYLLEQSLFALAFYPRGLALPVAENADRRLRSRTAELWNTMSPADETGH